MTSPRSIFMASSSSRYLQVGVVFMVLSFRTLYADFDVSFDKGSNLDPSFAVYGGAELASGAVQFSGAGRIAFKQPVKLRESFSSRFVFSISGGNVDGVAFLMAPAGYPANVLGNGPFGLATTEGRNSRNRFLAAEFDTRKDAEFGDLNANHVGVDVASLVSAKVSNVSSVHLSLNSGKKLQAWIDYQASSKRFEIRLGEPGEPKPPGPLLSYMVDLSRMWGETELFFSLSSAAGNGSECRVYSWEMKLRTVPRWMHSQPLDPNAYPMERVKPETQPTARVRLAERRECTFRVVGALILGVGCGALGALIVLFVWTLLGSRRPVAPEDYTKQEQLEFEYDKAKVVDVVPSGKNVD